MLEAHKASQYNKIYTIYTKIHYFLERVYINIEKIAIIPSLRNKAMP
jgi:hypothetical protein